MKKRLAFVLVLIFVFTSVFPVLALTGTGISQEKAIEKVKAIFDTGAYDRFNINYNENHMGKKVWQLRWSNTKEPYGSLNANIDADSGDILSIYLYRGYEPDGKTSPIPKYNNDQAQKIAEEFAQKLQPKEFAKTRLSDREQMYHPMDGSYRDEYYFNFIRMESNIPVDNNGFNIAVDAHTGDVRNYDFNWNWDSLPSAERIISQEEAEKIFKDDVGLKLIYQRYFDYRTKDENIKLIYTLDRPGNVLIDAITGELLEEDYYRSYNEAAMDSAKMAEEGFTPAEQKEVDITKNCISKETAIDIVKKYISIPDGFKQNWANLYEDYNNPGEKVWNIDWNKTDEQGGSGYIYARVNAVNSELLSFDYHDYSERSQKFKQNYDRAAAQKKAEEFLNECQPERFKNVKLEELEGKTEFPEKVERHYFNYTRVVDGILFPANGFNLTVDAETGKITSYSMRWQAREFPSADGVLSKTDAENQFLEDIGLELSYVPIYKPKEETQKYYLVYKVKPSKSYNFDAFDFKPLDYRGNPIEEEIQTAFTDIKGHWAESEIQLLVNLGVIKSTKDKFMPNENITEGEFIKLLLIAKNHGIPDDEIEKYIEAAQKLGWIKPGEVETKRPLSREKEAAFVVRAMGFEKIASLSDIFKITVKDSNVINPEYKGHVVIAMGLKLLTEDDDNINPKISVSRAQAATVLVRMLKSESN